ncbi:MAG: ABC transporter permease [Chloroflexaceae bacterium]|nr:ABC transporter permease [Chloroflexaceae bacterium]
MNYIIDNPDIVLGLLWQHLQMTGIGVLVGLLIAVPIGTLISHYRWLTVPVMGALGIFYTIPSLAVMIMLIPIFGLNATSVIIALILYVQVILVRNVVTGLQSVHPMLLEASRGMGMDPWQRWYRVQVPLALPIMLAGVRIATVVAVGIAAIGAKFGAGGLGVLLFDGIAQNRDDKIWAGTIVLAVLAFALNGLLLALERAFDPMQRIKRAERREQAARQAQEEAAIS